jgi:hypothetical protein
MLILVKGTAPWPKTVILSDDELDDLAMIAMKATPPPHRDEVRASKL